MTRRDLIDLLALGALWGASFLFMRMGAFEFGPVALVFLRVAGASLLLLPLLALRGGLGALRTHWKPIAAVGIVNSVFPFLLFALAALTLSTALMSVFNATASIWGALVAWLWLGDRLDRSRWLGLVIGVLGVVGRRYHADFRTILRRALRNRNGFIRAQAAAVASGLSTDERSRLWSDAPPAAEPAASGRHPAAPNTDTRRA